jgi:hypothetical protein
MIELWIPQEVNKAMLFIGNSRVEMSRKDIKKIAEIIEPYKEMCKRIAYDH